MAADRSGLSWLGCARRRHVLGTRMLRTWLIPSNSLDVHRTPNRCFSPETTERLRTAMPRPPPRLPQSPPGTVLHPQDAQRHPAIGEASTHTQQPVATTS